MVFKIIIIAIVYMIIVIALRIMYKDVKNSNKKRVRKKAFGLEVIECSARTNLKKGGVIPLQSIITIGRKEDNMLVLDDPYVSGYHVKIMPSNGEIVIYDLDSTNGTLVNDMRINAPVRLKLGDIVKVGSSTFKVIG